MTVYTVEMTVCVSDFLLDGYLKIVTITILFTGCYKELLQ